MNYFALSCLLVIFARENSAQQCDYYQSMEQRKEYFIYNREYPNWYSGEQHCYWKAEIPLYSDIVVNCVVEIPSYDRLTIRVQGENDWIINSSGAFSRVYKGTGLEAYFDSTSYSNGGRFQCSLVAQNGVPIPSTCDCGWKYEKKIVGGVQSGVNEFPFLAGIVEFFRDNNGLIYDSRIICGSTIISPYHVMTAAHCMLQFNINNLAIVVGEHNYRIGTETTATKVHRIQSFVTHEQYNNQTFENDIAIILTQTQIQFNLRVGPACLPYTLWVTDGTYDVTVMGWGTTEFSGPASDYVRKVSLNTITQSSCYSKNRNVKPSQMCTLTPGKDACQFDSGSPAVYFDPSRQRYKCVGIVSFGSGCGDSNPGVYTRIQSYIPWIETKTGYNFCKK